MAKRPIVPKFGSWDKDKDDLGYTVYFNKLRENKGATAPPLQRPHNLYDDPDDGPLMMVPPPSSSSSSSSSSRPATAGGHRETQPRRHHHHHHGGGGHHHSHHRRAESSSSVASDPGSGHQSKFAPPPQLFYLRASQHQQLQQQNQQQAHQQHHHGGGYYQQQQQQQKEKEQQHGHGQGGHRASHHAHRQHHQPTAGPRARSASPQSNPNRQRPTAVPKFGVWDEQTAAKAAQGFTVQFDNLKRHREVARSGMPVPRVPSPPEGAALRRHHQKNHPFVSKMFGCFLPTTAKS